MKKSSFTKKQKYLFALFILAVLLCLTINYSKKNEIHIISINLIDFPDKPLLNASIQGKKASLLIDTGSYSEFSLHTSVLNLVEKKQFKENSEIMDAKGDIYSLRKFLIPSMTIGDMKMEQIVAREENSDFFINAGLLRLAPLSEERNQKKIKHIQGKVGRLFLSKWTCLFDCPNSKLLLAKNAKSLINLYPSEKFMEIPFLNKAGIIASFRTDLGVKSFLLDTGANVSLLRESQIDKKLAQEVYPGFWKYRMNTLQSNQKELGASDFYLCDFCSEIPADGVLGIDFFKTHIVLIDFEHKLLYISNASK